MAVHKQSVMTLCVLLGVASLVRVEADYRVDIGWAALEQHLGSELPTGAGVGVTQVEAFSGDAYMPDASSPEFAGKTINQLSGASGVSSHAQMVGIYYYGLFTSISPEAAPIDVYEANAWLSGFLNYNDRAQPETESRYTQNHSWIGTTGQTGLDEQLLRRLDMVVHRDGVVVAAGVNNGAGSQMPSLMCSAYNVLAVGVTDGSSSYGPTILDTPGRSKPDVVVPSSLTSYGTPLVASTATILFDAAAQLGALSQLPADQIKSARALLIRGLLIGAATKEEFSDWRRGFTTPDSTGAVPYDYRYGAGELNVYNSYMMLAAGQQASGETSDVSHAGWDYNAAEVNVPQRYFIEIPPFQIGELSIALVWNRLLTLAKNETSPEAAMANLDLRLFHADGYQPGALIDLSISSIDNVEHLYQTGLLPGRYVIEVTASEFWNYALTWRMSVSDTAAADFDGDGDVDEDDVLFFGSCITGSESTTALSPGCQAADLDNDADVDQSDFGLLQPCFSSDKELPPPDCES